MIKSICIEKIFTELDFYDRFKAVADAGFTHMEIGCWCNRDVDRMAEELQKNGLTMTTLSADYKGSLIVPEDRNEFIDYLGRSIEAAKKLGCVRGVIHSQAMDEFGQFANDGSSLNDVTKIASAARTGMEAAKLAEENGFTLTLEGVNNITKPGYYMTTSEMVGSLCKVIDSDYFKMLYDIWHMQLMEGNLVTHLRKFADVLGYIHVGDCPERHEPGTGEINFDKLKELLDNELGMKDLVWGFELDPMIDSDDCATKIKAF